MIGVVFVRYQILFWAILLLSSYLEFILITHHEGCGTVFDCLCSGGKYLSQLDIGSNTVKVAGIYVRQLAG